MNLAVIEKVFSEEHDQRERELAEYRAAIAARDRGDHVAKERHLKRFAEIHAQRPAEMVERLERERGLE